MGNYISFEDAESILGIDKYYLGRIKSGYLHEFIKDKKFNIKKYQDRIDDIQEKRHLAHCIYYVMSDTLYTNDEELAEYFSKNYGRKKDEWYRFLDIDLFSIDKNKLALSWFESTMVNNVYEEVKEMEERGEIDFASYLY